MSQRKVFEVAFQGIRFRVTGDYSPGRPGVHTLRNGDPGWPDEPAELDIETVETKLKGEITLPLWADVTELLVAFKVDLGDPSDPFVVAALEALENQLGEAEACWRAGDDS